MVADKGDIFNGVVVVVGGVGRQNAREDRHTMYRRKKLNRAQEIDEMDGRIAGVTAAFYDSSFLINNWKCLGDLLVNDNNDCLKMEIMSEILVTIK